MRNPQRVTLEITVIVDEAGMGSFLEGAGGRVVLSNGQGVQLSGEVTHRNFEERTFEEHNSYFHDSAELFGLDEGYFDQDIFSPRTGDEVMMPQPQAHLTVTGSNSIAQDSAIASSVHTSFSERLNSLPASRQRGGGAVVRSTSARSSEWSRSSSWPIAAGRSWPVRL